MTHSLTANQYEGLYQRSLTDPAKFWGEQAEKFVTWFQRWNNVLQGDFNSVSIQWFSGGRLNVCYNCLDRHIETRGNKVAIIWEGDNPQESKKITYKELCDQVSCFANALKKLGVKKGDRVCIYLPMIPEAIVAMLTCARIGAIHSVVFGGFSPEALHDRIVNAGCKIVITANESVRGNKIIRLKQNVDEALKTCPDVKSVIVVKRTQTEVVLQENRDVWYHEIIKDVSNKSPCEMMEANDPLFILYTSGSTGKPKGILHSSGGYLVYTASTFQYVFNYQEGEVYWCTADIGWITGHSYGVYGPLALGATILLFEGIPSFPAPSRYWEIIDKHQVNIFYTAPTAIRALRKEGDDWVKKTNRKSLKVLGTVGEPINPDVWEWYSNIVGEGHCPVVDTWWQTETGGILISPLAEIGPFKPGSVGRPFFGINPKILDEKGNEVPDGTMGELVITEPWPGMMQSVYGDKKRFFESYFKQFPGCYLTGDDAKIDEQGLYWINGRNDDVIKVSGHRIGNAEIENALLHHPSVSEAGVIAVPHPIKGESIYAFICLKGNIKPSPQLKKELIEQVRNIVGHFAAPEYIQWADALPKTRSGKIMRRLLRKIATNELENLGDISTLAEPQVIENLIANRQDCKVV